jgi:hypothetical protein
MEWTEFLNDPELKAQSALYGTPTGKNLCKKVMHDVLEVLNTFKECANLVSTIPEELSPGWRLWFTKWTPFVERWVSEMVALAKQCEELPAESLAWSDVITRIGDVVEQGLVLELESQALNSPRTAVGRKVIKIALRATENLSLIEHDIRSRDYKRLWTIRRYGGSIENDSTKIEE